MKEWKEKTINNLREKQGIKNKTVRRKNIYQFLKKKREEGQPSTTKDGRYRN